MENTHTLSMYRNYIRVTNSTSNGRLRYADADKSYFLICHKRHMEKCENVVTFRHCVQCKSKRQTCYRIGTADDAASKRGKVRQRRE